MRLQFEQGLQKLPDDGERKYFQLISDPAKFRAGALDPLIKLLSIGVLQIDHSKRLSADELWCCYNF